VLFREWGYDPEQLTALRADHLRVREAVETFSNAAVQAEPPTPRHLSDLVAALVDTLSEHFEAEQTALQGELEIPPPSTAARAALHTSGNPRRGPRHRHGRSAQA
jgi:hypothetical protein